MSNIVLEAKNVSKSFSEGEQKTQVLREVSLQLAKGERAAILGRSGSGKTTLLHLLGGLDRIDSGEVFINGKNISNLSTDKIAALRNVNLGFVYQFHHLLPEFNALENVMMPKLIGKHGKTEANESAVEILEKLGLSNRIYHRPSKLSGGERQRVAIARALVNKPKVILADEPTGNLDAYNAEKVQDLILELNETFSLSCLLVTHDESMASRFGKIYRMQNGELIQE